MPFFVMIVAVLAMTEEPDNEQVRVVGRPWAPFISPMGEPFRARSTGDDPFARWFHQADSNADGRLTLDEMRADSNRFFRILDSDEDGEIGPEEITVYESEIAPEVQVNTRWKRSGQALAEEKPAKDGARGWKADKEVDGYQIHGLQGAARYGLLNIPEPVAGADADFNRGTTLDEFRRAAVQRFHLLDAKRAGYLTMPELELLLPTRPKGGKQADRPKDSPDPRIGLPFPEEN